MEAHETIQHTVDSLPKELTSSNFCLLATKPLNFEDADEHNLQTHKCNPYTQQA